VGADEAMRPDDYMIAAATASTGTPWRAGADPERNVMAELFGRTGGYSKGRRAARCTSSTLRAHHFYRGLRQFGGGQIPLATR